MNKYGRLKLMLYLCLRGTIWQYHTWDVYSLLKNTFMYTCILCMKIPFWYILCFTVNLPTLHLTATCNCGRLSHVGSPTCCLHQMLPVYLLSAAHNHHHHQNHFPPCNQHRYYCQHIIMKFNMGIIAKAIS